MRTAELQNIPFLVISTIAKFRKSFLKTPDLEVSDIFEISKKNMKIREFADFFREKKCMADARHDLHDVHHRERTQSK